MKNNTELNFFLNFKVLLCTQSTERANFPSGFLSIVTEVY
jgi:hypothetical protein